jgi:hypothetical protein
MRLINAFTRAGRPYGLVLLVHEGHNDDAISAYARERMTSYLVEHLTPELIHWLLVSGPPSPQR